MIYLTPFQKVHIATLISWVTNEDELVLFAGQNALHFPLTEEQITAYLADSDRQVFAALDNYTDQLLGMGEIFHSAPDKVRLCRILVDKAQRGRGIGQQLTLALTQTALADPHIQRVELNVYDFNVAAIRCYQICGFRMDEKQDENISSWKNWRNVRMYLER